MFERLKLFWSLFQKGKALTNVETWKAHQVTANMIAAVLIIGLQVLKTFDLNIALSDEVINEISAAILAVVNVVLTIITSKNAGFGSVKESVPPLPEIHLPETGEEVGNKPVNQVQETIPREATTAQKRDRVQPDIDDNEQLRGS